VDVRRGQLLVDEGQVLLEEDEQQRASLENDLALEQALGRV